MMWFPHCLESDYCSGLLVHSTQKDTITDPLLHSGNLVFDPKSADVE